MVLSFETIFINIISVAYTITDDISPLPVFGVLALGKDLYGTWRGI